MKSSYPNRRVYVLAILWFVFWLTPAFSAELTKEEIIQKSKEASLRPFKARMLSAGVEGMFYKKVLANGTFATRFEMSKPISRITISNPEGTYEVYPDKHLAIDLAYQKGLLQKAEQLAGTASVPKTLDASSGDVKYLGMKTHNGMNVYEFEQSLPLAVQEVMNKAITALTPNSATKGLIPDKIVTDIDSTTFQVVVYTTYTGRSILSHIEYIDLEVPADLPDTLFETPKDVNLRVAKSIKEYVDIQNDDIMPRPHVHKGWVYDPVTHHIVREGTLSKTPENSDKSAASMIDSQQKYKLVRLLFLILVGVLSALFVIKVIFNSKKNRK